VTALVAAADKKSENCSSKESLTTLLRWHHGKNVTDFTQINYCLFSIRIRRLFPSFIYVIYSFCILFVSNTIPSIGRFFLMWAVYTGFMLNAQHCTCPSMYIIVCCISYTLKDQNENTYAYKWWYPVWKLFLYSQAKKLLQTAYSFKAVVPKQNMQTLLKIMYFPLLFYNIHVPFFPSRQTLHMAHLLSAKQCFRNHFLSERKGNQCNYAAGTGRK